MTQYESPITLVAGEMQTTMEANCLKVVQSYGFDVNAKELAKALAYDRDQYDKGYAAARQRYERPHGEWIGGMKCSICGEFSSDNGKFCTNCGAKMEADDD